MIPHRSAAEPVVLARVSSRDCLVSIPGQPRQTGLWGVRFPFRPWHLGNQCRIRVYPNCPGNHPGGFQPAGLQVQPVPAWNHGAPALSRNDPSSNQSPVLGSVVESPGLAFSARPFSRLLCHCNKHGLRSMDGGEVQGDTFQRCVMPARRSHPMWARSRFPKRRHDPQPSRALHTPGRTIPEGNAYPSPGLPSEAPATPGPCPPTSFHSLRKCIWGIWFRHGS